MKTIKIEMIHDFVCSWCHIGYHHLTAALEDLKGEIQAEIHFLPFELNPDLGPQGISIDDYFIVGHGWSENQHKQYRKKLLTTAEQAGARIDFNYRTHYFNTHLAHRLISEASAETDTRKLHQRIIHAYHSQGKNIGSKAVLEEIGKDMGLSKKLINRALTPDFHSNAFEQDRNRASAFTVSSVPAWVFNEDTFVSGSNSKAAFYSLIKTLSNPKELAACQ